MNNFIINKYVYFVHLPKTGGTSFAPHGKKKNKQISNIGHCFHVKNIYRVPRFSGGHSSHNSVFFPCYKYPDKIEKPNTKISIIRNPFDLLCSYYHHGEKLKSDNKYGHSGWLSVNYIHQFKTFKEFIIAYCNPNFDWHIPQIQKFLFSQLFDINHNCVADIIVKFEYMDEAIEILNKKMIYPIKDRLINKSKNKKKCYKEYYDQEMIELINKKCYRELKYFNYNFNNSTIHEPLIVDCKIKYDVYNDQIIDK